MAHKNQTVANAMQPYEAENHSVLRCLPKVPIERPVLRSSWASCSTNAGQPHKMIAGQRYCCSVVQYRDNRSVPIRLMLSQECCRGTLHSQHENCVVDDDMLIWKSSDSQVNFMVVDAWSVCYYTTRRSSARNGNWSV